MLFALQVFIKKNPGSKVGKVCLEQSSNTWCAQDIDCYFSLCSLGDLIGSDLLFLSNPCVIFCAVSKTLCLSSYHGDQVADSQKGAKERPGEARS